MSKRGSIASCACASCRKRKIRCDGSRPTCEACEQRRVECRYDFEEGVTRTAALKSKLEQLGLAYGGFVDLHSQLKHGQPDEVATLINRIRAEDSMDARAPVELDGTIPNGHLLDGHVEPDPSKDMASEANWDFSETPSTRFGDIQRQTYQKPPFCTGMLTEIFIDPALAGIDPALASMDPVLAGLDPQLNQYNQPNPTNLAEKSRVLAPLEQGPYLDMYALPVSSLGAPISARQLLRMHAPSMLCANIPIVRHGMALQSRSMPKGCSAYSVSQVESLISVVEMNADHEIPGARLCELSSVAAVAAQYVQGALHPGVIEFFYDAAKHFFDDCMQCPIPYLIPLKVCAMLALANILGKSSLAFVYIDLGLSLAQNLDNPTSSKQQNLQRPEFIEAKRVRGTLLSLRGYAHKYGGTSVEAMGSGGSIGQSRGTWLQ